MARTTGSCDFEYMWVSETSAWAEMTSSCDLAKQVRWVLGLTRMTGSCILGKQMKDARAKTTNCYDLGLGLGLGLGQGKLTYAKNLGKKPEVIRPRSVGTVDWPHGKKLLAINSYCSLAVLINPRRACAARVMVLAVCVCLLPLYRRHSPILRSN